MASHVRCGTLGILGRCPHLGFGPKSTHTTSRRPTNNKCSLIAGVQH
jgi:hypothetical protein